MKNFIILALLCLGLSTTSQAQKSKSTPSAEKAFQQKFAGAVENPFKLDPIYQIELTYTPHFILTPVRHFKDYGKRIRTIGL